MPEENETQTWNGEGLPPVGVKFEACNRGDGNWRKAEMLFAGKEIGVMRLDTGPEYSFYVNEWEYRPIRTPELVAAEERRSAIDALADELAGYQGCKAKDRHQNLALYLHDQGYRKQVEP